MSDFAELERYAVLLAMAEAGFREINCAVSLEFCQALSAVFMIIPSHVAFGIEPEDIHRDVLAAARLRGLDPFVLRLRQRCEERCLMEEA